MSSVLAAESKGGSPVRFLAPILAGTALFVLHGLLMLGGGIDDWRPALWIAAVAGVALVAYGSVVLGRRLSAERERARELSVTRSRLQALVDASPLAITAGDLEGRIFLWNAAAEEIFGWPASEVLGRPYPAVPTEREGEWRTMRQRVLAGEVIHDIRTERLTRGGRTVDVSVSAAPVRNGTGEITGTMALVDDLGRSAAAAEVDRLKSQLRQAQKLEVVGRLTAGIAHDFNNLLTAIRGNADLMLASEATPPELEDDLQEIARSADRAGALTRQLLTFTHQAPVENRPVDVNQLVKGMETLIQRLVGETIELRVEPSVATGAVLTDPSQIEQVLMNLVVNARDALPDGGRIVIGTRAVDVSPEEARSLPYEVRPGPFAMITVTDNGVGMDRGTTERIFDPFFTTKPAGVGTGLGLSTAYSIVKQARGHIRVESAPGAGTTFRVYLPRHEAQARPQREDRTPATANGGSETILVVEDEAAVLSLAQRALERQGYHVLPALSGREALGLALKYPGEIHVLFCDMVMPDLTGREVAERVKDVRPEIAILMTSGYGERQLEVEGVSGDVAFLPKPYSPAELAARIRAMLGGALKPEEAK